MFGVKKSVKYLERFCSDTNGSEVKTHILVIFWKFKITETTPTRAFWYVFTSVRYIKNCITQFVIFKFNFFNSKFIVWYLHVTFKKNTIIEKYILITMQNLLNYSIIIWYETN